MGEMGNARHSSNPSPALGNARHHRGLGGPRPASQDCQLTYDRSTPHPRAEAHVCEKVAPDKDQPHPAHAWAEECRVSRSTPADHRPAHRRPPMAREPHITAHHAHRSTPASPSIMAAYRHLDIGLVRLSANGCRNRVHATARRCRRGRSCRCSECPHGLSHVTRKCHATTSNVIWPIGHPLSLSPICEQMIATGSWIAGSWAANLVAGRSGSRAARKPASPGRSRADGRRASALGRCRGGTGGQRA
jgi:hypothetical protein